MTLAFALRTPTGGIECAELEVVFRCSSATRKVTVRSVIVKPPAA